MVMVDEIVAVDIAIVVVVFVAITVEFAVVMRCAIAVVGGGCQVESIHCSQSG